jgi:hypothetical protein
VVAGADDFTIQVGGYVSGLTGLTGGTVYFLDDDTAGLLTSTEPPDVGDVSKPLFVADSGSSGWFFNWRGAVVAAAGSDAASDPIFDIFGAPDTAFEFDSSSLSGLTGYGSPDVEDADTSYPDCLYLFRSSGSVAACGRYLSAPSAPWTAIAKVSAFSHWQDNQFLMLFHAVNSGGPIQLFGSMLKGRYGYPTEAVAAYWTNTTTFDSYLGSVAVNGRTVPVYLAIRVNSATDIDYLFSWDGYIWVTIENARNPTVAQDLVGLGICTPANATIKTLAAFDFLRIFESALTLPGSV